MKIKLFLAFFASLSLYAHAQLADGYYRVKNTETQRYLYVYDDKGVANANLINIDAIYLQADLSNAIANPGSIIYIEKHGSKYDFASQGTSVYSILGDYLSLTERNGHYSVGANKGGVSAYLSDSKTGDHDGYGRISTDSKGARLWDPILVDSSNDNYFGVKPSLEFDSNYYSSFYSSFGYSPLSSSTKFFYVNKIGNKSVLLKEIDGVVPMKTPVIVSSNSNKASDNKLNLQSNSSSLSDNLLKGVYFDTDNSDFRPATYGDHQNQTTVENNHRLLNVNSDGKLVFSKSSLSTHPANSAYIEVPADAASVLFVCFTEEEFDYSEINSISSISSDTKRSKVYNVLGKAIDDCEHLPAGIYIIDGSKSIIR